MRVIVVTGAGRGFCAGADTKALEGHVDRGGYDAGVDDDLARPGWGVQPEFDADFAYHFGIPKPIMAAINGPAAGVGLVLACYCDLRFAAEGAKLTTSHGRLGLPAEYGLSWLLPRLIGVSRAADFLLEPGRAGRRGRDDGVGQSGRERARADGGHLHLRPRPGDGDRPLLTGFDEVPALSRPPP